MPIKINLLAEALAEEELRRRDPVKRSIFIGVLLVVLSFVWFSSTWVTYLLNKNRLVQIQTDIQGRTNEYSQVLINLKKIADGQKRLDALQKLSDARFLQGNLFNALQQLYVPNVQMTRMRIDQVFTMKDSPAATNAVTGSVTPKSGTATERITVTFDAKDLSSPNPGDQVNHFKDSVTKQKFFQAYLEPAGNVRLLNLTPPQSSADGKPFVLFTLECRFPDKVR